MEEIGEEHTDGSSIQPVSSLRSHFEQIAKSKPKKPLPLKRSTSPNRSSTEKAPLETLRISQARASLDLPRSEKAENSNNRNWLGGAPSAGLHPVASNNTREPSPLPAIKPRPRPISQIDPHTYSNPPSVIVDPPKSPPKSLSLTLDGAINLKIDDALRGQFGPATPSPRHTRSPSRPHTPLTEARKSPLFPTNQPPEPPPPRRSGEFRREASSKTAAAPPPVKRGEKPKVAEKQLLLGHSSDHPNLVPASPAEDKASPFSTPPSSGASADGANSPPPLPLTKPSLDTYQTANSAQTKNAFEPPPIHHSIVSRRRDQEAVAFARNGTWGPSSGDQPHDRPALPIRRDAPAADTSGTRKLPSIAGLPPPPTRVSQEQTRSPLLSQSNRSAQLEHSTGYSVPPKRNFTAPGQQTPPAVRSHGRSMTLDTTSDRVPADFRSPSTPIISRQEPRILKDPEQFKKPAVDLSSKVADYPDSSFSNRRPPYLKQGSREIGNRSDTRLIDVCGELICTSGHVTRVWSLFDGEQIMSLPHLENVKILSLAFKPGTDVDSEGSRIWLGNNIGDLLEVDMLTGDVVAAKSSAHSRREIIKIYRHLNEMWTLDDSGTLHLWAPDDSGVPTLRSPYQSFRVAKGHTFSMVVGDDLWLASGKDIRVFRPTIDGSVQFQVLARPLCRESAGEVTSGALTASQPDRVFFGHSDGKITIYARDDYACLGEVNVSVYKINTLAAVGDFLWAGYSTGMIYVYDTKQSPWVVRKDWHAHDHPVISLTADRSSCWKIDRSQVVSLGADNVLRIWDGLLQDDWLDTEMKAKDKTYCNFEKINALVMTWNAGASTPHSLRYAESDSKFIKGMFQTSGSPDILVFGFQELVDLEDKKTTAKSFFKSRKKDSSEQAHMSHQYRDWRDYLALCLDDYMPGKELYHLLHTSNMVGLFTCIFVKASLRDRIRNIDGAEVKRGMGGLHGNKGALILRFIIDDTSLCFINCHLAAGQGQTANRNNDISAILESSILPMERDTSMRTDNFVGGGDGSMILDHEICILNGDLNYRIDTMSRDAVVNAVKANNLGRLLERDQLLVSRKKNPAFRLRAFLELPITFAPTYKYDVGTDNYDSSEKRRAPAWCDRLLYRGRDRIEQLDYRRHEVRVSDHRPVTGTFKIIIKTVVPQQRAVAWDACRRTFEEVRHRLSVESKLDFLHNVCGFSKEKSKDLITKQNKEHRKP